jgi:hypothetical protein
VYIDVESSEKLFLSVLTNTADDRAFSIKVSQLTIYENLAPIGCLQYYTEINGTLSSFNYEDYSQIQKRRNPSYFVSNYFDDLCCTLSMRCSYIKLNITLYNIFIL